MQPQAAQTVQTVSTIGALVYLAVLAGIIVYAFTLVVRLVRAHERVANALEDLASRDSE